MGWEEKKIESSGGRFEYMIRSVMSDYERMRMGAEAASERAAAVKKAKLQSQQSDAEAARSAFRTKGVPFSDAKGSGHIVNGKKVYAS